MELDRLRLFLQRHARIALDTSVFIYQLEAYTRYLALTNPIFAWIERTGSKAVTSTVTMAELLAQPYRQRDEQRVDEIYGLLTTFPNLEWIASNLEISDLAARMRALYRMRTPDALQAATAVHALATGLITNDQVFERVESLDTLLLDSLL